MATPPIKLPKSRAAFQELDLAQYKVELVITQPKSKRGVREPTLRVTPAIKLPGMVKPIGEVSVFTATTKMRCASWSLPAGPPKFGGTCPASGLKPAERLDDEWICSGCYATTGNYRYATVQTIQGLRRLWTERTLADGTFADQMSWALAQMLASPRFGTVPKGSRAKKPLLDPKYFRIHDSGDFSWGKEAYIRAWFTIASRFPGVRFWAPTRDWTGKLGERYIPVFAQAPANLTIRPSALFTNEAPPVVPGMAAGSSVAVAGRDVKFLEDPRGERVFNCPAYAQDEHSCESGRNPNGKKGCRACWIMPQLEINYAPHGGISREGELVQLRIRKNPADTLDTLYRKFQADRRAGKHRLGEASHMFPAWLAQGGLRPTSFPEESWLHLMREWGVQDQAEQMELLESLLEW